MLQLLNAGIANWQALAGGSALLLVGLLFASYGGYAAYANLTTPDWRRSNPDTTMTETDFLEGAIGAVIFIGIGLDVITTGGQTISDIAEHLTRRC